MSVSMSMSSPSTTSVSVDDKSGSSTAGGDKIKEPTTTTAAAATAATTGTDTAAATVAANPTVEDVAVSSTPPPPPLVPGDGGRVSPGVPSVGVSMVGGGLQVRAAVSDGQGKGRGYGDHKWCEFNDTVVKEWTVEGRRRRGTGKGEGEKDGAGGSGSRIGGLETDCFGGQQTMHVRAIMCTYVLARRKCAFILGKGAGVPGFFFLCRMCRLCVIGSCAFCWC